MKLLKIQTIYYTIMVTFCSPIFFQHKKIISNLIVKLSTLYGIYFISMVFFSLWNNQNFCNPFFSTEWFYPKDFFIMVNQDKCEEKSLY